VFFFFFFFFYTETEAEAQGTVALPHRHLCLGHSSIHRAQDDKRNVRPYLEEREVAVPHSRVPASAADKNLREQGLEALAA